MRALWSLERVSWMGALVDIDLPREPTAGRRARELLAVHLTAELDQTELDTAKLIVTELVNNAVLHGQGTIALRVHLDADRLRIDVIDGGSGFERKARRSKLDDFGGRGLRIVDAAASRWGVHEGTTHVWCELELAGPRLGPG
jgi:anti-sigma regulatory factor (Ser/Thr protein kinase)